MAAVIGNYKSIRSCEVPLDGMTVLLGRNGAGKSNVIEALAAYDPALRSGLAETRRLAKIDRTRVGLVVRFQSSADGTGPDSELLRELITAHWRAGSDPSDLAIETGAYCGSAWWLYSGANLFDEHDQRSLGSCLQVVKASMLFGVDPRHLAVATKLVDELFDEPIVIIQEDFAVELSCDPDSPLLLEAMQLDLLDVESESAFYDLILAALSGFRDRRWKPLIRLSTGLSSDAPTRAAGFDWTIDRFGGITWLSGDVETLEAHLDSMLPRVHDKILHSAPFLGDVPYDEDCEVCMASDHGSRVDPAIYDEIGEFRGSETWLEEQGGWFRIRPSLRAALTIVEEEANRSLPQFLSELGFVRLAFTPTTEWGGDRLSRCEVRFSEFAELPADPTGAEGEVGNSLRSAGQHSMTELRIAELGQGFQRWIATAVRIAIDRCADGEVHLSEPVDFLHLDHQSIELSYQAESLRPRILLIDEPEQHLHVSAQHQAALWCMSQARTNHAVLVASHSPAFAALPPERATTCMVTKANRQTTVQILAPIHGPDAVARAQELGFELGMGRTALAQFTRAVLVVEGEWDRRLLYAFFGHDLAAQRVLVVPLQGSDELLALADAAVIPALGVPVVALLDEVRAVSVADIATLTPPLSKAERGLRDLSAALGADLSIVRYEDPDIICGLPEAAVHRAFPSAKFPGWNELLSNWLQARQLGETQDSFKKWALGGMGLPKKDRYPPTFFRAVLAATTPADRPGRRLEQAVKQALALVDAPV
jgi:hypothetical protein